mmetsp:Transcript_29931/g.90602  ORF Transcript_29931/g.90602 Transcript_29931/m.90602 type:complete len:209 (-) Transcript_29931:317-943(-)
MVLPFLSRPVCFHVLPVPFENLLPPLLLLLLAIHVFVPTFDATSVLFAIGGAVGLGIAGVGCIIPKLLLLEGHLDGPRAAIERRAIQNAHSVLSLCMLGKRHHRGPPRHVLHLQHLADLSEMVQQHLVLRVEIEIPNVHDAIRLDVRGPRRAAYPLPRPSSCALAERVVVVDRPALRRRRRRRGRVERPVAAQGGRLALALSPSRLVM